MRKPTDILKSIHAYVGENIVRDKKLLTSLQYKIRLMFIGLAGYFIFMGSSHLFYGEYFSAIILYSFTLLPVFAYRRSVKRTKRLMERLDNQRERLEDIGKELYNTREDEKLT